jgi:hypothetical protein
MLLRRSGRYLVYFLLLFLIYLSSFSLVIQSASVIPTLKPINQTEGITFLRNITVYYDPPSGTVSTTALGVYVWSNYPNTRIYYDVLGGLPNFNSSYADSSRPYIQLDTPFGVKRNRTLTLIALYTDTKGVSFHSVHHFLRYYVEGASRPNSYGYMIPGVESGGYFLQLTMEVAATARAQAAGSQEFADFFSDLGYGTYRTQISALHLPTIDPDLNGFEGGFSCKFH